MLPIKADRRRAAEPQIRLAAIIVLFFCASSGTHLSIAEDSVLKSIDLCNGKDRTTPATQISGCTAVINSKAATSVGLAIAYNNRADAYMSEGKYELAISDYDRSVMLNPRFAKAYNNRGVAYAKTGDLSRAVQNFAAAIDFDGQYANAYVNRGDAFLRQREFHKAFSDYDAALKIKPDSTNAWSGRCWAQAQMGELPQALKDCNEALRTGPSSSALQARAFIHLKLQLWDAAISDYDAVLKIEPKLATGLYGRGLARIRKGDRVNAEADVTAAQQLDPNVAQTFKAAGLE